MNRFELRRAYRGRNITALVLRTEAGVSVTLSGGGRPHINYTYILRCKDGSLYTGWTNDLEKRVAAHNAGAGSKYTRSRRPVALVYYESFPTKSEAMRREAQIKRLTRGEKLRLIAGSGP